MFVDNRRFISEKETRDNYIILDLKQNSKDKDWKKAIDIMRERLKGRYLDQISFLIQSDINKNGFAAMALICLLIETLMQFREGIPQNKDYPNSKYYSRFLQNQLGEIFDGEISSRFYKDIRCGILHSAQTKNNSCLTFDTDYVARIQGNGVMMVDIRNLYYAVVRYFEEYCDELRNSENNQLRYNFICKMDDITKKFAGKSEMDNIWFAICEKEGIVIESKDSLFFIQKCFEDKMIIQKGRRGYSRPFDMKTETIKITKEEIEDALYYWPNEGAIKMLEKGNIIVEIIKLCREVAEDIIQSRIA
ncbi:MAG: hypothetical protein J5625_04190 [Lachnospiraceae bacterium]|nr:hypothetical protein [Lachnospiraceae bacterium]